MIARSTKIQLVLFALVTVVGVTYVALTYTGIPQFFGAGYVVTARFEDSGGIFPAAQVTYRGKGIGEVEELRLTEGGVAVVMRLEDGTRVPADTVATVNSLSVVGEQYVSLRPRSRGGPYLQDGSVIPQSRTDLPTPEVETLLLNLNELVASIGQENLVTVIDELNKAFEGVGPDLERLIDSGNALIEAADANLPQTKKLITDGETVLETQVEVSGAIKSFAEDLAKLTDQLRESDPDIRATLEEGVDASTELTALLESVQPALHVLLDNLVTTGQIVRARLPGVEQVLVLFPLSVAQAFTAAPGDGTAHFGLVLNVNAPPPCTEGYQSTERTYPQNTSPKEGEITVYCREDDDTSIAVRGSRYATSPAGVPEGSVAPAGGGTSEKGGLLRLYPEVIGSGTSPGADSSGREGPLVGVYDPATGRIIAPGSGSYRLGSTGGQQRVLGEDSWKWLLLGPLGG